MKKTFILILCLIFTISSAYARGLRQRNNTAQEPAQHVQNVPPGAAAFQLRQIINDGNVVFYSEYGAVGDGVTDDFDAIIRTHHAANELGKKVSADPGATYYIGGSGRTAEIQTDTYWGDAKFIIDNTRLENRRSYVFTVTSKLPKIDIKTI